MKTASACQKNPDCGNRCRYTCAMSPNWHVGSLTRSDSVLKLNLLAFFTTWGNIAYSFRTICGEFGSLESTLITRSMEQPWHGVGQWRDTMPYRRHLQSPAIMLGCLMRTTWKELLQVDVTQRKRLLQIYCLCLRTKPSRSSGERRKLCNGRSKVVTKTRRSVWRLQPEWCSRH